MWVVHIYLGDRWEVSPWPVSKHRLCTYQRQREFITRPGLRLDIWFSLVDKRGEGIMLSAGSAGRPRLHSMDVSRTSLANSITIAQKIAL